MTDTVASITNRVYYLPFQGHGSSSHVPQCANWKKTWSKNFITFHILRNVLLDQTKDSTAQVTSFLRLPTNVFRKLSTNIAYLIFTSRRDSFPCSQCLSNFLEDAYEKPCYIFANRFIFQKFNSLFESNYTFDLQILHGSKEHNYSLHKTSCYLLHAGGYFYWVFVSF